MSKSRRTGSPIRSSSIASDSDRAGASARHHVWWRGAAAFGAAAAALGFLGASAGPRWRPLPLQRTVAPEQADTAIVPAAGPAPEQRGPYPIERSLVRLRLGDCDAVVEVTRPAAPGRFPGLVFAHGAGTGNHTAFREHSDALARAGIVCLVPDKKLSTYTAFYRDYQAMAREYLDLAVWARHQPWIDPQRVGYWGESEGGWIVPISAAADPAPTFIVLVSASVVTPRQHSLFSVAAYLRNTGVPDAVFHAVPRFLGSPMPGGRVNYADFRVEPYLRQLSCPILMAYGTADSSVPTVQGPLLVLDEAASVGNSQVTVRYYPANHGLREGEDQHLDARFLADTAAWVGGLPATGTPAVGTRLAGTVPRQPFWVTPAPPVNWFGRVDVQACLGALSLGSVLIGPAVGLARRAMGRANRPLRSELRVPFAVFTAGSAGTVVGFAAYLSRVAHLALNYRREPLSVVWGHRGVRAAASLSVAAGALLSLRLRDLVASGDSPARDGAERWRLATGVAGASGLLVFASYWGILPLEPDPPRAGQHGTRRGEPPAGGARSR